MKFVKTSVARLAAEGRIHLIPVFAAFCLARYMGFKKGRNYEKMSRKAVLKATTDPDYFLGKWKMR